MKIKKDIVIKVLLMIITLMAGILISLLLQPGNQNEKNNFTQEKQPQNSLIPPVTINGKNVLYFGYAYSFGGTVGEFTPTGDNYRLTLKKENPEIPEVIITKLTSIIRRLGEGNTPERATIDEIKPGQNVILDAVYDVKRGFWRVERVNIVETIPPINPNL